MTEAVTVAAARRFPAFRRGLAFSAVKAFLKRVRRDCTAPGHAERPKAAGGGDFPKAGAERDRRAGADGPCGGVCQCALGPAAAHGPVRLVAAVFSGGTALVHEAGRSRV